MIFASWIVWFVTMQGLYWYARRLGRTYAESLGHKDPLPRATDMNVVRLWRMDAEIGRLLSVPVDDPTLEIRRQRALYWRRYWWRWILGIAVPWIVLAFALDAALRDVATPPAKIAALFPAIGAVGLLALAYGTRGWVRLVLVVIAAVVLLIAIAQFHA